MSTIFNWLDKASRCGDPLVEHSAKIMKDYYEGATPDRTAEQRERDEVLARRIQQRKWLKEEND